MCRDIMGNICHFPGSHIGKQHTIMSTAVFQTLQRAESVINRKEMKMNNGEELAWEFSRNHTPTVRQTQ